MSAVGVVTRCSSEGLLVSVKQAAQLLNLTPWSAYELCISGVLASGMQGRRRSVSLASVREYADRVLRGEAVAS